MEPQQQSKPYFKKDQIQNNNRIKSRDQTFRHFNALMRKNAISWKRTWCGSILEIICPMMIMLILAGVRTILDPETSPDYDMYSLQFPLYPPGAIDPQSKLWYVSEKGVAAQGQGLYNLLNYTNYSSSMNYTASQYNPSTDKQSPYWFAPPHCYLPDSVYHSPAIAVVKRNNTVERSVINQLEALFDSQRRTAKAQNITRYPMGNFTIKQFNDTDELFEYIGHDNYGYDAVNRPAICFGFSVTENSLSNYEVEVFFNDVQSRSFQSIPDQKKPSADPSVQGPLLTEYGQYTKNGYSMLTNWLANAVIKKATKTNTAQIAAILMPMQTRPTVTDNYTLLLQWILPFFLMLIYIPVLYRTVYRIVFEKVTKAKESMRMMGMGDFAYWSSWLAYYTCVNIMIVTGVWGVLEINSFSRDSATALWVWLFAYGQSLFGFIMIVQALFSSPRAAAITTTVVYFGTSVLSTVVTTENTPRNTKLAVCWFFPTVTMITGVQPLILTDASGIGLNFDTWSLQFLEFSVRDSFFLFIGGGIQLSLLGLYLEYVLPKTYGKRKNPLFFVTWLFDLCKTKKKIAYYLEQSGSDGDDDENKIFETQYLNKDCYEGVPNEVAVKEQENKVLKVSGLKKVYDNGFKAVNGINLMMYSDQIFVLLGHNGAGKTTTISMLTGLFGASKGQAELFGVDMFTDMDSVRQVMGVCPQHDVLFELLTVEEHLSFFYDLKGADPRHKRSEIEKLMKDVGVYDKRSALAYTLSGGNKRKLSVAIALCGGSKFVLLDEPTSGMDLSARRQLWNMLKEQKKDRIIILTTHYMDEADILGDRIGIMASGKLTALGSSIFLKTKFGVGYNLTIVKQNSKPNHLIIPFLQKYLGPDVKKQSEIQSEMTVQIPLEYNGQFVEFFKNFDENLIKLKIQSYGISISTLEEVFLKMGHLDDPTQPPELCDDMNSNPKDDDEKQQQEPEFNLKDNANDLDESFLNNLQAVLYKRYSNYKRNRKALFNEAIIPALIMILGIALTRIQPTYLSPSTIQDPYRLPLPQQLLMNSKPVVKSNNPNVMRWFSEDLPYSEDPDVFQFRWTKPRADNQTRTMRQFGQLVTDIGESIGREPPYMYGAYQVYKADDVTQQYQFISFVNLTSQDAAGLYPNYFYEAILKVATRNQDFKFKVRSTPYPPTQLTKARIETTAASTVIFVSAIAYSMMVVAVVSYLVVERTNGLKHLQIISGMQLSAYWIGNFMFDFLKMQVTICMTIVMFFGFDLGYENAAVTYACLPFGILPFTYVTSFIFNSDSAAQTFTMFFHFLILGIGATITYFLRLAPTLQIYGDALNLAMHFVPTYTLGASLYCETNCLFLSQIRQLPGSTGAALEEDVWAPNNITLDVQSLFVHFVVWTIQIVLIEKGFYSVFQVLPKGKSDPKSKVLDADVVKEATRVHKGANNDVIEVLDLKKVYSVASSGACRAKPLVAVNNLSFGLARGECFALLGVNGAGKSTTFKSLTKEVTPSRGVIKIAGINVQEDFDEARKLIGYCPQQNLIFEDMTVEEHLKYYAQVKGIPKNKRHQLIEKSIQQLGLGMHRSKPSGTLSGGNKRKLCVALAMVGNPPIIFLDEPSAGMDPESRRFMWSVVGKIAQKKTSAIVLTSHSMEEAEALSTKMGIMVKGGIFKCFGSAQHIKNKFGTGYVIEIKVKTLDDTELKDLMESGLSTDDALDQNQFSQQVNHLIKDQVKGLVGLKLWRQLHGDINLYSCILELTKTFDTIELIEKYGSYMRVRVARLDKSIGSVFGLVEQMRKQYDVSEYSVSQTTLEQIFQSFADLNFTENVQVFTSRDEELILASELEQKEPENAVETARMLKHGQNLTRLAGGYAL